MLDGRALLFLIVILLILLFLGWLDRHRATSGAMTHRPAGASLHCKQMQRPQRDRP